MVEAHEPYSPPVPDADPQFSVAGSNEAPQSWAETSAQLPAQEAATVADKQKAEEAWTYPGPNPPKAPETPEEQK